MNALKYGFPPKPLPYPNPYITPDMMACLIIAIICTLLLAWAFAYQEHLKLPPPDMFVSLDREEPEPRPRPRWHRVSPDEIPDEMREWMDDLFETFMIIDITDEMDEEP
jgi:hypothetical protein